MESIWNALMSIEISPVEKVIRTAAVYVGMLLLIRFLGRRIIAQMNSLDLVVVLLLSNVVQNSIIGPDNSLSGGLLGALVLVLVNQGLDRWAQHWPWLRRFLEGGPTVLIADGRFDEGAGQRMGLDEQDIAPALRNQGAASPADVRLATLAPDGALVVDLNDDAQSVTRADLAEALAQLRRDLAADLSNNQCAHRGSNPGPED